MAKRREEKRERFKWGRPGGEEDEREREKEERKARVFV
jgi:hypothetical protein